MQPGKVRITIIANGPAKVECDDAEIVMADGSIQTKTGRFSLCRCGESKSKPFCDGTHKTCGFEG